MIALSHFFSKHFTLRPFLIPKMIDIFFYPFCTLTRQSLPLDISVEDMYVRGLHVLYTVNQKDLF